MSAARENLLNGIDDKLSGKMVRGSRFSLFICSASVESHKSSEDVALLIRYHRVGSTGEQRTKRAII